MRKLYSILAVIAIAMITVCVTSCGNKKAPEAKSDIVSQTQLAGGYSIVAKNVNIFGEKVEQPVFGVQKNGKDLIEADYTKIELDKKLNVFKCYASNGEISLRTTDGKTIRTGIFTEVTLDENGAYYRFKDKEGKVGVYSTKGKTSWGMYDDVITTDYFIFKKTGDRWGFVTITGEPNWDAEYDKIYVLNYKDKKHYDIVMLSNGTWEMCDQDKKYYDASQSDIKGLIGKTKAPAGLIDKKW
ncbi:MAG: hypothetical protein Q4D80_03495 [Pseudomonadota bacterium]|nr:hypothetical protein [Pseudomonadota bacterium]